MLNEALLRLEAEGVHVVRRSRMVPTAPQYVVDQPEFLNIAVEVETEHFVTELLRRTQAVEKAMGRVKLRDKGPRNIDIDILLFDELTLRSPKLNIPHLHMYERPFVLIPLAEIAPHLVPAGLK